MRSVKHMEDYNKIYPQLPNNNFQTQNGDNVVSFRLQKSSEVIQNLEKEIKHYEEVRKKYNRARTIFTKISVGSGTISIILSASGLSTSLTGFGAIFGIPLGVVGGIFGALSVGFGIGTKNLSNKVSKHERTVSTAQAKLNTINDLVSKALKDNVISDQEFSIILAELEKFQKLKQEIRQKFNRDSQKNLDMSMIKREAREKILKELTEGRGH